MKIVDSDKENAGILFCLKERSEWMREIKCTGEKITETLVKIE